MLAALVAATSLGGCWLFEDPARRSVRHPEAARASRGSLFEHRWVWTDEQGRSVRFDRWRGQPLVVTAIFTSCRATCPRTIQKLRGVYARLSREGRPPPDFVLVTLDPRNDTPARLRRFKQTEGFPDSWHLLSGSEPQTRALADLLGIHVMDADEHIMHDGKIVVFDAHGMPTRSYGGWGLDDEAPVL